MTILKGSNFCLCSTELSTGATINKWRDREKDVVAGTRFLILPKENGDGGNSKLILSGEQALLGTFVAPNEPLSN